MNNNYDSDANLPGLIPHTPVDLLTPRLALELEAVRYLFVACLAAFTWETLCTLSKDYCLISLYAPSVPCAVYFISRISTLAFILTCTIFYMAPVDSCHGLQIAQGCCWAVAAPSTSLLFFFRVRAVCDRHQIIVRFSAILWLATLGGSIAVPFAFTGGHIGGTNRCIDSSVKSFSSASIIAGTLYDTFVFMAISWNIVRRATLKGSFKSFFGGRDLPYISRELLQGGQHYYLITVGVNALTMAIILSPSTPSVIRTMVVPDIALQNSMACRVYRNLKLGRTDHDYYTSEETSEDGEAPTYALKTFGGTQTRPVHGPVLGIVRPVEQFDDRESVQAIMHDRDMGSKVQCSDIEYL